jgi:hypothetical protein
LKDRLILTGWAIVKNAKVAVHVSGISIRFKHTNEGWHLAVDNTNAASSASVNIADVEKDAQTMLEDGLI